MLGSLAVWFFYWQSRKPVSEKPQGKQPHLLRERFQHTSTLLATLTIALSVLVLTRWMLDIKVLQIEQSHALMMPNAALGTLAASVAIWLGNQRYQARALIGRWCFALIPGVTGALTLVDMPPRGTYILMRS